MNLNGGNVLVNILIIIALGASIAAIFALSKQASRTSQETVENSKSIKGIWGHLDEIDKSIDDSRERVESITSFVTNLKSRVDEFEKSQESEIASLREHIDRFQQNDRIIVERYNNLSTQLERATASLNRPIKVEFPEMQTRSISTIIKKNGRYYRKTRAKHEKLIDEPRKTRPVIQEIKEKIAEAGL